MLRIVYLWVLMCCISLFFTGCQDVKIGGDAESDDRSNSNITYYADEEAPNFKSEPDVTELKENIKVRSQKDMWTIIHHMANTKIVADRIWGEVEITDQLVAELIVEVEHSNYSDKNKLLEILNNWKNHDFSKAVDEHNYVWQKLGGTVGRATQLRDY